MSSHPLRTHGPGNHPHFEPGQKWSNDAGAWVVEYVTGQPLGRIGLRDGSGNRYEVRTLTMFHWAVTGAGKLVDEGIPRGSWRSPEGTQRHRQLRTRANPSRIRWDGTPTSTDGPEW